MTDPVALSTDGSEAETPSKGPCGICVSIHSVRASPPPMIGPLVKYSVAVSRLRRVLSKITRVATPLSVGDFVSGLKGNALPGKFLIVTFDDGYRDTLELAEPVLTELGIPFSIFITTGILDRRSVPVEIELGRHFESGLRVTRWTPIDRVLAFVSGSARKQRSAYEIERKRLKAASDVERTRALKSLTGGEAGEGFDLFLTWDDVRGLAKSPLVTIGAHGCAHLDLTAASSADAESEIWDSRRRIADELGAKPEFFCYAYGAAHQVHAEMVEQAGYLAAFGTEPQVVKPDNVNLYRIPRIEISDSAVLTRALALLDRQ